MPNPPAATRYTLALNVAEWYRITRAAGLTTEQKQADAIGIARETLNRIRNGRTPSPEFIAAVRAAFPEVDQDRLFSVVTKAAS